MTGRPRPAPSGAGPADGCLLALALVLVALVLAGCGHSTMSSVCPPQARSALARFLRVDAGSIAAVGSTGSQAMAQCDFRAHPTGGSAVTVTATVDTAPQAYFRLERTAVEAGQNFSHAPLFVAPQNVPGLGLDADWFPAQTQLMTTDGTRLITVAVNWPGSSQARQLALAVAAARRYLGRLRPQAAVPGGG